MSTGEVIAWVLNLDAEFELMDPAHVPSPRLAAETRERARRLVPMIRAATGCEVDMLDGSRPASQRPPTRGDCWCPTPKARARLARAGVEPPGAPPVDVLRAVNHRAFASALGFALPGAGFETTVDGCLSRIRTAPDSRWVLKRPLGFSGRMRKVVVPGNLDRAALTWITASMRQYGAGLQIEPLVDRLADYSLHGWLEPAGAVRVGVPIALSCDDQGRFVDARRARESELTSAERPRLTAAFERVVEALRAAGYFGPFGIDAFAWRDTSGARRFHPLSELNARYSMAWWTGMAPVLA